MFTLPGIWELASLLAKLLLYVGAFSIAGGSLSAWRYSNADRSLLFSNFSYVFFGTVIGFHGAVLGFLVQVGLINDSGLPGMIDWGMISILLDTGLGDVTLLRLLAFIL
ncbi:MAG: putative copper resistance protein D, partial [Cyclobacteriaceae bacterium]